MRPLLLGHPPLLPFIILLLAIALPVVSFSVADRNPFLRPPRILAPLSSSSASSALEGSLLLPSESSAAVVREAHAALAGEFAAVDWRTQRHIRRVLASFRRHRVGSAELNSGLDGYAHGDLGRDAIDKVYADVMGAEAALVRSQIFSGTHAIACALFGVLRPGDTLLAVSGAPYDTLEEVIGLRPSSVCDDEGDGEGEDEDGATTAAGGTLRDWGVGYEQVELTADGRFDLDAIDAALATQPSVRMIHVQRSCGYQWRPSLPMAEIGRLCDHVRAINEDRRRMRRKWRQAGAARNDDDDHDHDHDHDQQLLPPPLCDLVVFVDNCYGEFVEDAEPCAAGADLVAGSLIKNPGGTLARTGGYVAGRRRLVRGAANRLSAPGVDGGATLGQNKLVLQGLFNAPGTVGESLKGAMLLAQVLGGAFGLECNPPPPLVATPPHLPSGGGEGGEGGEGQGGEDKGGFRSSGHVRTDMIQAVQLGSRERLVRFCEAVQRHSPVDAHVRPTPGRTPGYGDEVIFADGSFVDGATAELSADGPLREPFTAYAQGGTHVMHWAVVLEAVIDDMGMLAASAPPAA
jgi:cystathionine beta-lyase family protein involved in aluminum resistance